MTRVSFVVPVHGRHTLAQVCLRQLARTCAGMGEYGLDATAVVVGEGPLLEHARTLGFTTVSRDNRYLGRRFNDGYQQACDPEHNPQPADYVVPCGSDDWVDPVIFQRLPPPGKIGVFRRLAVVNEARTRISRLWMNSLAGPGIRIIPRDLVARAGYRPANEHRTRGCDTSTMYGLVRANAGGGASQLLVELDVHPLQIVDWKTHGQQLNSYQELRAVHRGPENTDPYRLLAGHYPDEALAEMRAL